MCVCVWLSWWERGVDVLGPAHTGILNPTLPIPAYTLYIQVTDCRYFEGPRLRGNSKARQQAELAFDRKRKRYLVFENFSPHRLRLKNSVILLKNLGSFCLREPEELNRFLELESEAPQEILEDRPRMFYEYDLFSSPPMSPGCCRCLQDFILHIENGQYLFFFFDDYCFVRERETLPVEYFFLLQVGSWSGAIVVCVHRDYCVLEATELGRGCMELPCVPLFYLHCIHHR